MKIREERRKKKNVVALVQARMGSKRLPDKVLIPIIGKPILWHIVNRLKYSKLVDQIVIATTDKEKDAPIRAMAEANNFPYYAGSEEDLLDRFYQASKKFRADIIVRITADCPLIDPQIIDTVIDFFLKRKGRYEYISNARPSSSLPHGLDCEVFSFSLLERLWKETKDSFQREWFTSVVFENPRRYRTFCIKNNVNLSHIRLTVDYPEDLELVRFVYQNLYSANRCFYLTDIVKLLAKNPEMMNINQKYARDEQYISELAKRKVI